MENLTNNPKLVLAGFSGTIANTEELSLGKENLYSVYRLAITQMFGETGEYLLLHRGGMSNISNIQKLFFELLSNKICLSHVCRYMNTNEVTLLRNDPTPLIFKEFVNLSVKLLHNLIGGPTPSGTVWPSIYPGFSKFRGLLKEKNIDLGIISSGFSNFISSVFKVHQIEGPDFSVTLDDEFQTLGLSWESKVKPSPMLVANAIQQWSNMHSSINLDMDYALQNTIMIGDDLELDGKMAESLNLPFWYFTSDINNIILSEGKNISTFSNWGQLINALNGGKLFI